jgi:hypothetical protein
MWIVTLAFASIPVVMVAYDEYLAHKKDRYHA